MATKFFCATLLHDTEWLSCLAYATCLVIWCKIVNLFLFGATCYNYMTCMILASCKHVGCLQLTVYMHPAGT